MRLYLKLLAILIFIQTYLFGQSEPTNDIQSVRTDGYNSRFTDTSKCFSLQFDALEKAKRSNAKEEIIISYAMLSLTYKRFLKTNLAQLYADSAFYLSKENKTPLAQAYALMATGLLKSYLDQDKQALDDLIAAYSFFGTVNDFKNKARIAAEISYLYAASAEPVLQVEKFADLALQNAEKANTAEEILYARLAFGSLLISKTKAGIKLTADSAINYFKQTILLAEANNAKIYTKSNLAIAYFNLSVLYVRNPFPKSEELFLSVLDKALSIAKQYNVRTVYRNSLGLKGEYFLQKKDYVSADKLFKDGIAFQRTLPFPDYRSYTNFYGSLKDLAIKQKNYKAYYEYDTTFVKYNKFHYDEATQQAMQNADARFESSLKATQITALEKENKLQRTNKWLGFGAAILLAFGLMFLFMFYYFRQKYYMQSEIILIEKQKTTELQLQLKQQEAMEALSQKLSMERRLLQSQMDPHFVFNALGNIQSFVLQNETKNAIGYLSTFSKLMRQILSHSKKEAITLMDEIDTLKNYIELQKLRLNHSFNYLIKTDDGLDVQSKIPPMLIQPFIENAIEHGLKPLENKKGEMEILFSDDEQNDCLVCTITDNGVGYEFSKQLEQNNKHESMATAITLERMEQMVKENDFAGFSIKEIKTDNGAVLGTQVIIKIPYYKA